jgi:aspartate racemase
MTIGLLGGMSWESTVPYYQVINRTVAARLGGLHSARLVLYSVDFQPVETMQAASDWERAGEWLGDAGRCLRNAGADFLVLCTNTMHRVASAVETAAAVRHDGLGRVGLLGTRFTMEQDFYRGRLEARHGLEILVPEAPDRRELHRVIYEELCRGRVEAGSRERLRRVISRLADRGAEGIILGCTEIGLLITPAESDLPLFDTTRIHAEAAALRALGQPGRADHDG